MLGARGAMMREPCFTQTVQIGIVVRDLDATMRNYVDEYGIGPWKMYELTGRNCANTASRSGAPGA